MGLLLHELGLADQKRDQSVALLAELIVNVPQPFQRVSRKTLGLVAVQDDDVPLPNLELLAQSADQREALVGDGRRRIAHTCGSQQGVEERAFELISVMLARHPQHEDIGTVARQVDGGVVNRVRLSHAWPGVDHCAGYEQ